MSEFALGRPFSWRLASFPIPKRSVSRCFEFQNCKWWLVFLIEDARHYRLSLQVSDSTRAILPFRTICFVGWLSSTHGVSSVSVKECRSGSRPYDVWIAPDKFISDMKDISLADSMMFVVHFDVESGGMPAGHDPERGRMPSGLDPELGRILFGLDPERGRIPFGLEERVIFLPHVGKKNLTCKRQIRQKLNLISSEISSSNSSADKCTNTSLDLAGLSSDFGDLLESGEASDVELKCEGVTRPAHRSVLSARSEVFSAMFRNKMAESATGVVDIEDLDEELLDQLLKYVYTGDLPDPQEGRTHELYAVADKYAVHLLKKTCSDRMLENLSPENYQAFLITADIHGGKELKEALVEAIAQQPGWLDCDEWYKFIEEHPKLANEVYRKYYDKTKTGARGASGAVN